MRFFEKTQSTTGTHQKNTADVHSNTLQTKHKKQAPSPQPPAPSPARTFQTIPLGGDTTSPSSGTQSLKTLGNFKEKHPIFKNPREFQKKQKTKISKLTQSGDTRDSRGFFVFIKNTRGFQKTKISLANLVRYLAG